MDWVHCNQCGTKPNKIKLFATFCGHIFCQNCIQKLKDNQCIMCKKPLQYAEINQRMPPEMLELFKDPKQVAADAMKDLKHVIAFQETQRAIHNKFQQMKLKSENDKYFKQQSQQVQAKQEMDSAKATLTNVAEELKKAKDKKKLLMIRLHQIRKQNSTTRINTKASILPGQCKTDPVSSKFARFRPPQKNVLVTEKVANLDETYSKTVTSTPIGNISCSRRDHMTRLFGSGAINPSPIAR